GDHLRLRQGVLRRVPCADRLQMQGLPRRRRPHQPAQAASASRARRKEARDTMKGKIGLEEHFATDDTLADSKGFLPDHTWPELRGRLIDFHERRIAEMDRNGVEMMILSLN